MKELQKFILPLLLNFVLSANMWAQGAPRVIDFAPKRYSTQNSLSPVITASFDTQMDANTINSANVLVYGEHSGVHSGNLGFLSNTRTFAFSPLTPFISGEMVTVILTDKVAAANGRSLTTSFQWSFLIMVAKSQSVFESDAKYSVQSGPQGLALADFNKDTYIDVAVSHSGVNNVEIFFNDGTGKLQFQNSVKVGIQPRSIVAGHFDSDADIDLAVANEGSGTISILLNDGQGSFSNQNTFSVSGSVLAFIVTGEFNGDGKLDFATVNRGSNDISIILNSDTTLTELGPFAVGLSPRIGFTADFNNDGILDIATANKGDSTFSVIIGVGDGTFQPQQTFTADADPHFISGGDLNGDNNIDIVLTNRAADTVWPLFNNGKSQFTLGGISQVGREPRSLLVRDLDGDSDFDIIAGNFSSDDLTYLRNAGLGTFVKDSTYAAGNAPRIILGADMDLDGDLDLVVSNWQESTIQIFKNRGAGLLNTPPSAPTLISPADGVFFNGSSPPLTLEWRVPDDADNDLLHFRIELARDASFTSTSIIESINDPTGFSPAPPVPAGKDSVRYTFGTDLVDGKLWWRVSAWDGTIYGTPSLPRTLTIDKTPPSGSVASSPPLSSDKDFVVSWSRGADTGSGLSGLFDVMVQVDAGPWTVWQSSFPDTFSTYNGQHSHTYGFEAAAHDSAGNIELFSQVAETITLVDTVANDVTAPGPPLSLTASGSNPSPWQNTPSFQISWVSPADRSGINRALYKLGSPPIANFDTTASVPNTTSLNVNATQEDGQSLHLWFQDGQGNLDYRNRETVPLRYDGTTPVISSLSTTNADFANQWINQKRTSLAQVNVKYNEKHMRQLSLESVGLNTVISLEQIPSGANISFNVGLSIQDKSDGLHELEVTLIDSAGNTDSSTTNLGLDSTPPAGTQASSPDTSTSRNFVVTWTGSGTDSGGSGLSGAYDVRYQVDNGSWMELAVNVVQTSITFQGEQRKTYGFEVVAHDNVGNVEPFSEQAESVTVVDTGFVDIDAPTIAHQPLTLVNEGEDVIISADILDNSQIAQAVVFYKQSGKEVFQATQMTQTIDNTYSVTIPASEVSIFGLNYYIQAWDGINFSYFPQTDWDTMPINLSVRIAGVNGEGLLKNTTQPAGEESSFYRMISIPIDLTNKNSLAVFEDDLGPYDAVGWRLFQYKTSTASYAEYPNVSLFGPGVAGWLIVRDPNKQIDSGVGSTLSSNTPFEITLEQGWNDFGIPFTFPVDWNDIQVISSAAGNVMGPYTYQGQWILPNQISTLFPWEGYSVFSQSSSVRLAIPPKQSAATQTVVGLSKKSAGLDWFIGIQSSAGTLHETSTYLGVAQEASNTWDKFDYLQPPYIADFISTHFVHTEWQEFRGNFTTDIRPPFSGGQVWHFEVTTNIPATVVKLKFTNLLSVPKDFKVILHDNSNFQERDLKQLGEYTFIPEQNKLKRQFDLVVGTSDYLENADQVKELQPETFLLSQNFPNPFNAGTSFYYQIAEHSQVRITILNILGQQVRSLFSEQKAPGRYRINWDGKDDNGLEIGSGIYIIQLKAGKFQQTRKMILLR